MFASFDKAGKRLATCSTRSNVAILWDLDTLKELRRFVHQQPVQRVALSPDGVLALPLAPACPTTTDGASWPSGTSRRATS